MARHLLREGIRLPDGHRPLRSIQPGVPLQGRCPRPLGPSGRVLLRRDLGALVEIEEGKRSPQTTGRNELVGSTDSVVFPMNLWYLIFLCFALRLKKKSFSFRLSSHRPLLIGDSDLDSFLPIPFRVHYYTAVFYSIPFYSVRTTLGG